MIRLLAAAAISVVSFSNLAAAQSFEAGYEAYMNQEYDTAFRELKPIAADGLAEAQVLIGQMYFAGQGVQENEMEAVNWLTLAAEQNDAVGQFFLGLIYSQSDVIDRDDELAVQLFKKSAEQGFAMAQAVLGERYEKGKGVPQDFAEAVRLYRLASGQGVSGAQFRLARAYELGNGVPQDFVQAHKWYNISAANGDDLAGDRRDSLAENMPAADVSEAQRSATVCVDSGYKDCN